MAAQSPRWIAGGTIEVSRFVKADIGAGKLYKALQAGANDKIVGISQDGPYDAPGVTGAADDAARENLPLKVFGLGEECLLKAGTGGWTAGDHLESDASGQGVTVAVTVASVRNIGAIGLETVAAGELGRVQIVLFTKTNPA